VISRKFIDFKKIINPRYCFYIHFHDFIVTLNS